MKIRTADGKVKDVDLSKVTEQNYICPEGEEQLYHVTIENTQFDPETGLKTSAPSLQKYGKKYFEEEGRNQLSLSGYSVVILHDAQKWEDEQAALAAKAAEEAAKQAAKEAKAKADAELLAKLEEEMKAEQEEE